MTLPSVKPSFSNDDVFLQPQLQRYHHPFRSPMNSEIMNLEINQLRYDVLKLYDKINTLQTSMQSYFSVLVNGSGNDVYSMVFAGATPSSNYGIVSINVITQALEAMSERLFILEKRL